MALGLPECLVNLAELVWRRWRLAIGFVRRLRGPIDGGGGCEALAALLSTLAPPLELLRARLLFLALPLGPFEPTARTAAVLIITCLLIILFSAEMRKIFGQKLSAQTAGSRASLAAAAPGGAWPGRETKWAPRKRETS